MTTSAEDAAPKEEAAGAVETGSAAEVDLRRWERVASGALGAALVVQGLRRRSRAGLASAGVGGALLYRGLTGRGPFSGGGRDAEAEVYRREDADEGATVERTVTVGRPADELGEYWRDPEQLSRLLGDVAEVSDAGGDRLRWEIEGPFGRSVSWQSRLSSDRPGEEIRWTAVDGSMFANEWTVRFDEGEDGEETRVTLSVHVEPPGGAAGRAVAGRLLPEAAVGTILDRFKSLAETGEIPTIDENPSARGKGDRI